MVLCQMCRVVFRTFLDAMDKTASLEECVGGLSQRAFHGMLLRKIISQPVGVLQCLGNPRRSCANIMYPMALLAVVFIAPVSNSSQCLLVKSVQFLWMHSG